MDDKILFRVNSLLKQIDFILNDTKDVNLSSLDENSVLLRATCFSIAQIGEKMVQLEKKIGDKYPDLPWVYARNMRNIIVHDYEKIDIEQVRSTVIIDIPLLKDSFLQIKKDYEK